MKGYSFRSLTDLVLKIFKTKVNAGTGLSGGGSLEADRTLTVMYGTAAGTAAQGNDGRLSNSREWTAATITQAETEAGTATTRRAFTAQRVRQAIVAWWSSITGVFGRDLVTSVDNIVARSKLGLGNSATRNVGTAAGNVMEVGAGGWMGRGAVSNEPYGYPANIFDTTNQSKVLRSNADDNGVEKHAAGIHFSAGDTWGRLRVAYYGPRAWIQGGSAGNGFGWTSQVVLSDNLQQATGTSSSFPMSQAATTNQLATKANTSTQVIAGTGLSGGGNLSANRTLNVSYGTTAGTSVQGNDSRVVNAASNATVIAKEAALEAKKADKVTTITAGTGLSGGGTLAANRSLSVNYGTTAGTAVQGNDSRVVNALQRGNNLNDITNNTLARSNLGLGTAATENIGTTVGLVPIIGLYRSLSGSDDLNLLSGPSHVGEYSWGGVIPLNAPSGTAFAYLRVTTWGDGAQQHAHDAANRSYYRNKQNGSSTWSSWVTTHHTGNILQTTGTSPAYPMSQKAVTDALDTKAASSHTHPWAQVTGQPATATRWPSLAEVTGKPANYPTTWGSVAAKPAQATRWPTWAEVTGRPVSHTPLGVGQTWQDVSASRNKGTTYTNTTGRSIVVSVVCQGDIGNPASEIFVNNVRVGFVVDTQDYFDSQMTTIVPSGATYRVDSLGVIVLFAELR